MHLLPSSPWLPSCRTGGPIRWQGNEPKFTESYKGGQGAVHISKVKFDESAQAYVVQVSVPVLDAGHAIGAITVGINIDELDKAGH